MTTIRCIAFLSLLGILPASGEARANDGAPAKFYVPRDGGSRHGGLSAALRARLRRSVEAERGDPEKGSGARVWGLLVVQTQYYDEDLLNEFWLTWSNDYLNPNGLALFANGDPVVYEGTAIPVVLDGTEVETTVFGEGDVGTGLIEFEVVGLNGTASDSIIGLRAQPFGDPDPLTCTDGPRNPKTSACSLLLNITNTRQPEFYYVTFDGRELDDTIPGVSSYTFKDIKKGPHTVGLLGAISEDGNDYVGDYVETACDIVCLDLPCDRPFDMDSCQTGFGPLDSDNKVHLTWVNGEDYYESLTVTVDAGAPVAIPGDAFETTLENLSPGDHTVALEGDCGEKGKSEPSTYAFSVSGDVPPAEPLKDFSCKFPSPSATTMVATWKNLADASSIEVYVVSAADERRLDRTLSGQATSVVVSNTLLTDRLGLTFTFSGNGKCYSSPMQLCTPGGPPGWKYLIGDCDGNSNYDITDAIFSLNRLFRGGKESLCGPSCDANSDFAFNLADVIFTLHNLFQGGPPPGGNFPLCDETASGEPTCSESTCNR